MIDYHFFSHYEITKKVNYPYSYKDTIIAKKDIYINNIKIEYNEHQNKIAILKLLNGGGI